jgi:hypothetical protein
MTAVIGVSRIAQACGGVCLMRAGDADAPPVVDSSWKRRPPWLTQM